MGKKERNRNKRKETNCLKLKDRKSSETSENIPESATVHESSSSHESASNLESSGCPESDSVHESQRDHEFTAHRNSNPSRAAADSVNIDEKFDTKIVSDTGGAKKKSCALDSETQDKLIHNTHRSTREMERLPCPNVHPVYPKSFMKSEKARNPVRKSSKNNTECGCKYYKGKVDNTTTLSQTVGARKKTVRPSYPREQGERMLNTSLSSGAKRKECLPCPNVRHPVPRKSFMKYKSSRTNRESMSESYAQMNKQTCRKSPAQVDNNTTLSYTGGARKKTGKPLDPRDQCEQMQNTYLSSGAKKKEGLPSSAGDSIKKKSKIGSKSKQSKHTEDPLQTNLKDEAFDISNITRQLPDLNLQSSESSDVRGASESVVNESIEFISDEDSQEKKRITRNTNYKNKHKDCNRDIDSSKNRPSNSNRESYDKIKIHNTHTSSCDKDFSYDSRNICMDNLNQEYQEDYSEMVDKSASNPSDANESDTGSLQLTEDSSEMLDRSANSPSNPKESD